VQFVNTKTKRCSKNTNQQLQFGRRRRPMPQLTLRIAVTLITLRVLNWLM